MKTYVAFLAALLSSASYAAEFIDCGEATIQRVYVQADRQDNSSHQSSLLIQLGADKSEACNSVEFGQLKNTDLAYDGVLSMALAAFYGGHKLRVVLNSTHSGTTYPIAWVNVVK